MRGNDHAGTSGARRQAACLMSETAQWQLGLALGIVVIAVAAHHRDRHRDARAADRRAGQDSVEAVDVVREQTDALSGIGRINDSGVRILHAARALRKVAVGK